MSSSPHEHLLQGSVVRKTKEKFDSFLKDALQESSQMSPKGHAEPKTSKTSVSVHNISEPSEEEKREFILNKFFANSSLLEDTEVKPIPKPRTKLRSKNVRNETLSPHSSNETFRIGKPKEISPEGKKSLHSGSSPSSTNTYKVSSPKIVNTQDDELSSQKTFRISKNVVPKIGDIIIHEKESIPKIVDVEVKNDNISFLKQNSRESSYNSSNSQKNSGDENNIHLQKDEGVEHEHKTNNYQLSKDGEVVGNVLNIRIHKTDKLQLNSLVIHPVVKIHIVDIHTGNYFPKNHERLVKYPLEDNLDHLAPIMTHPYSLQEKRSLIPTWEETILIHEDYTYIIEKKENIIIFFEILDFLPMPLINNKTKGWHRIAFAFLKVSGKNNVLNFNKNMRLQLYQCTSKKEDGRKCSIWENWYKGRLSKYPSSLYVSITSSALKNEISARLPLSEKGIEGTSELAKEAVNLSLKNTLAENQDWGKTAKGITKLPNECLAHFDTAKEGCFTLRFNHNGSLLACALRLNNVYCVVIFSTVTFEQVCYFPGHQDLIYSICWSPDDTQIIACSADCSVSVWDVNQVSFLQILPHPSFVYTIDMSSNLIVTGCYDTKLRVWTNDGLRKYFLNQELDGHNGYITSLLLKKSYDTILSSDSLGVIIEWYKQKNTWVLHKKINILGLEGIIINQIEFIAKERRLLVHSRDNILRIIDLESSIVIHWLQGGLNTRFHTSCSISPCGSYIIAGSENSAVNIWKVKSGKFVGSLIPYKNKVVTIHALQFHPKDNIIALGSFGDDLPVLLLGHNEENEDCKIDLRLVAEKKKNTTEKDKSKKDILKSDQSNLHFKNVLDKLDKLMVGKLK